MTIHENIKNQMKEAMMAKDAVRLSVLRGLVAAFMNELIAKKNPAPLIGDDEANTVIKRQVKQRKDSIEQFTAGGRKDLVKAESAELAILETFLPQMTSRADIEKVVKAKIKEAGGAAKLDKAKMGQFMGSVMKEFKGKADGSLVKEVVESLLK